MLLYVGFTFTFFWLNGLIQGLLSYFPSLDSGKQRSFLFQVYLLFCGIAIVIGILLFTSEKWITPLLTGQVKLEYFHLYLIFLLLSVPSYLVEYFYLLHEKAQAIINWAVFTFGMQALVFLGPIFLGWGIYYGFLGLAGLGILKHLWVWVVLRKFATARLQPGLLQPYIQLSLPLIYYALIAGLALLFDNWLVGWYYKSEEQFAVFKYGARELPLVTALAAALSASMIPDLVATPELSLDVLKNKAKKLMHWLFPISILFLLISDWAYPLVFSAEFSASAAIFDVYLLIIISRLLFPHSILIAQKKTKVLAYTAVIELAINIILSFIFVEYWGMPGIAMATVIAFMFEKVWYAIYLHRNSKINWHQYTPVRVVGLYSVLLILVFVVKYTI